MRMSYTIHPFPVIPNPTRNKLRGARIRYNGYTVTPQEERYRLRKEAKKLRQENAVIARSKITRETRADSDGRTIATFKKKVKMLTEENAKLKEEVHDLKIKLGVEIEKAKKYAGMLFKASVRRIPSGAKRGARAGHKGAHRKQTDHIDKEIRVSLTHCPDCHTALARTDSCDTRVVEDIPVEKVIVTKYEIERPWCVQCRKEMSGVPRDTLPGFSIGLNTIVCILFLKYRLRAPLGRITEYLASQHRLVITEGGVPSILHSCKERFGAEYKRILDEIRRAPFKHADETSWKILGEKGWAWLFSTPSAAYYTIEETKKEACSEEMQSLHAELGVLFGELNTANKRSFVMSERVRARAAFLMRIDTIIGRSYAGTDARSVQTRIKNQRTHLVEALLHEGAPLTNNHAERMIRPLVVTRTISGGSQSDAGAATHAVNMSIMQTLSLRGTSFFDGIRRLIHAGNARYAAGNGWMVTCEE